MTIIYHPKYPEVVGVRAVKPLTGFTVHVVFTDNTERDIDLDPYLRGPVFEPIRNDPRMFASVFVDPIGQTLAWPNEVDIAPETLYYDGNPPWATDETQTPSRVAKPKRRYASKKTLSRRVTHRRKVKAVV